jgi:hypothetical protein
MRLEVISTVITGLILATGYLLIMWLYFDGLSGMKDIW